jgi:hypothetical protein
VRLSILLLLSACAVDNSFNGDTKPPGFDTGDPPDSPPIDTDDPPDTDTDTDSGVVVVPDECEDTYYPGHSLDPGDSCDSPRAEPSWTLVSKWSVPGAGTMLSGPSIAQLTDDNGNGIIDDGDTPDVIIAPYSGSISAYNGTDGALLWTTSSSNNEQTTPSIGDLDGDGFPEVVVGGLSGSMALHGEDGSLYWTGPGSSSVKAYCGGVGIADLSGDGDPEVYIGRLIVNGQTGARLAEGAYGNGTAISGEAPNTVAADIDGDGDQEVVAGNAFYTISGSALWSGGTDGFPAVGQFDTDDEAEIVVATTSTLSLLEDSGTTIWTHSVSSGSSYMGPPVIADLDGDGDPEIAVPTSAGVIAFDDNGTEIWRYTTSSAGGFFDGLVAYDLDGDGAYELIHTGATAVDILDGATGAVKSTWAHTSHYQCGQPPSIADVDNDGHVDIAYGMYASGGGTGGAEVLEDSSGFVSGRPIWNQSAYNITNVTDESTIPTDPDPNWLSYNNFRAGATSETPTGDTNLLVAVHDVCESECADGKLTVTYSLGNDGSSAITDDVQVAVYGVTDSGDVLLATQTWTADLLPLYQTGSETIELTGVPSPLYDVYVTVDGGNDSPDSQVRECHEDDNEARWGAPVCI